MLSSSRNDLESVAGSCRISRPGECAREKHCQLSVSRELMACIFDRELTSCGQVHSSGIKFQIWVNFRAILLNLKKFSSQVVKGVRSIFCSRKFVCYQKVVLAKLSFTLQ